MVHQTLLVLGCSDFSYPGCSECQPCRCLHRSEPTESPRISPTSPRSYGLGATCGYHHGEGSSVPQPEKPSWPYSRVTESLFNNPEFIQDGFHIDRFVTAIADTEADQANTKALYLALETDLTHLDVSLSCSTLSLYSHGTVLTSLLM
jgi:hypothetical protein